MRQAQRFVRAMLEAGSCVGKIDPSQAGDKLTSIGYSRTIAMDRIKRYPLTNGYQLCYTMGKFGIETPEKRFIGRLGKKNFYEALPGSGQAPFHIIENKTEKLCQKNS